ncbi:uncharacterized protein LOC110656633 [Hevea brasiliensis]|uniref:uncharacterized protein LOC110656633 n=1 Tax=Hevea brasiliensis TaxID=3981 RepID=UPI0025FF7C5D|nr:uncharacterized protein LOC110656633 [Hevea brasiliensis]
MEDTTEQSQTPPEDFQENTYPLDQNTYSQEEEDDDECSSYGPSDCYDYLEEQEESNHGRENTSADYYDYLEEQEESNHGRENTSEENHFQRMNTERSLPFQGTYMCFPLSLIGKSQLEQGDQIIMPPSAFEHLLRLEVGFPMLFKISNDSKGRVSHCGVYEFTADEGSVFLPSWMMKNLQSQEGELLSLKSATLERGTYIKLQPHSMDFLGIVNPKAVLEWTLSSKFFCLTTGDTIVINYNSKNFFIDIVETRPSSAVCILDTDCEVDFAPPLDYKEPVKPAKIAKEEEQAEEKEPSKEKAMFIPFTGLPRRLDGKPAAELASSTSSSVGENNHTRTIDAESRSQKRPGKLVFGSPDSESKSEKTEAKIVRSESPKKQQFQPFTGKKHSLRG